MGARHGILYHARDLPNLVTLVNVGVGFGAILAVVDNHFPLALVLVMTGVFLDHLDGYLARRQSPRNEPRRNFGGELDSFSDLVSFGVVPAVLVVVLSGAGWIGFGAGLVLVLAAVARLAYFNLYGLAGGYFHGVPTTIAAFVFVIVVHVAFVAAVDVATVLPITALILAAAEVAPIRIPKPTYSIWAALIVTTSLSAIIWLTSGNMMP